MNTHSLKVNGFSWLSFAVALATVTALGCDTYALDAPPALPGTNWQLLSLTSRGEPIKDAQNPADVEFLKSGEWGVLHYGGFRQAGKYSVNGIELTMKTEDGDVYMQGKMNYQPADEVLEIDDGTYLMRLRRYKPK